MFIDCFKILFYLTLSHFLFSSLPLGLCHIFFFFILLVLIITSLNLLVKSVSKYYSHPPIPKSISFYTSCFYESFIFISKHNFPFLRLIFDVPFSSASSPLSANFQTIFIELFVELFVELFIRPFTNSNSLLRSAILN